MGQQTGFDLTVHRARAELSGLRVTAERTGMINERDAIRATECERIVGFNSMTLGAALHFGVLRLDAAFFPDRSSSL